MGENVQFSYIGLDGHYCHLPRNIPLIQAFNLARADLRGQQVVYLQVWPQSNIVPRNETAVKSEMKHLWNGDD